VSDWFFERRAGRGRPAQTWGSAPQAPTYDFMDPEDLALVYLLKPGGRKQVAHGASRGPAITSTAPGRGVRFPRAREPFAPFRGCPECHSIPQAHAWGYFLSPSGLAESAPSQRLWGSAPQAVFNQQQPILMSPPAVTGSPKASSGAGAPCSTAIQRRAASNTTSTTPTMKIAIRAESR
jgi:hypothetical protein